MASLGVITRRAYARIGLLGNPSDGFFGKTIAVSLQNFYAEVGWNLGQEEKPWSGLGAIAMLFRWMSAAHTLRCDARPTPASGFIYRQLRVFEPPGFVGLPGGAQVTLTPSDKIRFTPHPQHDLAELDSIQHLADRVATQGYHGAKQTRGLGFVFSR